VTELRTGATTSRAGSPDAFPYRLGPYEALGQAFMVRTDDAALASLLRELFAPMLINGTASWSHEAAVYCIASPSAFRDGYVMRDNAVVGASSSPSQVLQILQWAINRHVIEGACEQRLVLHAGAVDLDGHTIVLPAAMEAGKTTLTTGLLDRGFAYLSDEAAAVSADLIVEGYPKPLSLDPGSWAIFDHHKPAVDQETGKYLADQWSIPVLRVAAVKIFGRISVMIFPRYRKGATTSIEQVPPASAVVEAAQCVFTKRGSIMPTSHVRDLASIAESVACYRLVSGSLSEACEAVISVLDGDA
jgi:hypothetical protein